jgi:formamidopyrimidine-DNA glycosylase
MPELPEVETMRRGIAAVVGSRICDLRQVKSRLRPITLQPRLSEFRRRAVGRKIESLGRIGKRVVLGLDDGMRIVLEPRMSGIVTLRQPTDEAHLRLIFELSGVGVPQLFFWDQRGLGVVRLLDQRQFEAIYGPEKIGPDALEITAADLRRRLDRNGREIKVALLDQRVLAGIGNIYASEILHRAGIHPHLKCRLLTARQWKKLHAAIGQVLEEAIEHKGSTLNDRTYRVSRDEPGGFQLLHRVYHRAGQPCLTCKKGQIEQTRQAQRSTFFCPRCQRQPPD